MSSTILEPAFTKPTVASSSRFTFYSQDANAEAGDGGSIELEGRCHLESLTPTQSRSSGDEAAPNAVNDQSVDLSIKNILKLSSSTFSFFCAGINDGSLGALIPYIVRDYGISTGLVSLLFVTSFMGWLLAALVNVYVTSWFGMAGVLVLGAVLQLVGQFLRFWAPPFGLFATTFFLVALGTAFQDSHANTFVATVKSAHRWLGVVHASYGIGCLVGPLTATAVASSSPDRWALFYTCLVALAAVNLGGVIFSFWSDVMRRRKSQEPDKDGSNEQKNSALGEMKAAMKLKPVWLLSLFFFFHLGVAITAGGWIVEYLVTARNSNLSRVGFIPTGYYGGVALGRLLLAEPTFRLGERRMLTFYSALCLGLQLVFWLVPNLIVNAVAVSIMGFLLGPFFPTGISTGTKLFPKNLHASALGLVFVIGQAGGTIFPALVGLIATKAGVGVLQPMLVGLIVAMAISWILVPKITKPSE